MADLQPMPGFAFAGAVSAGGETGPFALAFPGPVTLFSVVTAVAGTSPDLQAFLDVNQDGNWVPLITLTAQTGAGVQSGSAQPPADSQGTYRIRWTLTGTNPLITGGMFAAGLA
jgi:hypothetical protein